MAREAKNGLFITGTDTEVGKTFVTSLIARALREKGANVGVYKPVASGCILRGDDISSEDAEQLWIAAGRPKTLGDVTPQRFAAPLAPNIAARVEGKRIDAELLRSGLDAWKDSDVVLVEGVGGLMSPISDDDLVRDLAVDFGFPLVVVVPNILGCINQTLLTLFAAQQSGLSVTGIVLNDVQPSADESCATNRDEIERLTDVPVLAGLCFGAKEIEVSALGVTWP